MQRRSANGRPVKGQRSKKPTRKASAAHLSTDHPQEQLVERLRRERDEAIELQAASAEVLKIIGSSPRDMKPVFEAMLVNALRICDAKFGHILLYDGERFHATHLYDVPPSYRAFWDQHGPIRPSPRTGLGRLARTKQVVHIPDLKADPTYTEREPLRVVTVEQAGARSFLAVPMLKANKLVGAIVIYRTEVRPFSDKQIELVKNFAAQAVIAMENARLVAETREALEQQTATAEVLRVINSSPGNLAPVFEAILEKAHGLCAVTYGSLQLYDGNEFRAVAVHGLSEAFAERLRQGYVPGPNHQSRRLMEGERFAQTPDMGEIDDPISRAAFEHSGIRTALFIPLRKEGRLIGQIVAARREVRPFNQKEIALLENFAAQAVIAMENARLFNETKEALERQTATASILSVISHSVADTQPVFEEILRSIAGPFDAEERCILLIGQDGLLHIGAYHGPGVERARALFPRPIKGTATETAVRERRLIQYPDVFNGPDVPPGLRDYARGFGRNYSLIVAPLLREDRPIGAILINSAAMRVFSQKECALLQTFADQAVIAIENARLFDEVQAKTRDLEEALEQESAGSEVLKLISMSSGDLEPVFQKLLESATRLCGAEFGIMNLLSGGMVRQVSFYNMPEAYVSEWSGKQYPPHPESVMGTIMRTRQAVHVDDLRTRPAYLAGNPAVVALSDIAGARTYVGVPLLPRDELVGMISIYRREVRPFDEKQVRLVERFASQAVIALENARLLNELRERTHQLSRSLENLRAAQDRLIQTEKLASLGQLTAGIAHEIKNPLNFVTNFSTLSAELIAELKDVLGRATLVDNLRTEVEELTGLLKDNLDKVVQHGKRADAIVKNMLLHSREGSGERRSADINALVKESLNLAYHGARAEKAGFKIGLRHDLDANAGPIEIYPQEITRALLNLISNGFYAATTRKLEAGDESFEPVLCVATRDLGKTVEIRIRDNGTGIPPEVREKIFNPFFTTKPTGEGTGLGLSISHDIIVKQHGGRIDIETETGVFTEFIITLPRDIGTRGAEKPE